MHRADFTVPCVDERDARVLHDAVGVEADEGPDGTMTVLTVVGPVIQVAVEAQDLSGLRAAVHSVLRLLDAARRIAE